MRQQLFAIAFLVFTATALKISPPPTLNDTNFEQVTNATIDAFLQNGSANDAPWFIMFKVPGCKHCHQGEMLFNSFYIEFNKRLHFEAEAAKEQLETNFMFGIIDCEESPLLCERFNIDHYPTYYVIEGTGEICAYIGDRMPYSMITFLEERKKDRRNDKCKVIGKMTLSTKLLAYFEPLIEFANYNTALFMIAFIVGPFLFGYLFSRNKKQPVVQSDAQPVADTKSE